MKAKKKVTSSPKARPYRGAFITFEGGEAVGKSTQIALLAEALRAEGFRVHTTREPGGTGLGEEIRSLIKTQPMHPRTELLLFEASRVELVESELKPRLKKGEIILCDRFEESSVVYQGVARGLSSSMVLSANRLATDGLHADFIVLLDGRVMSDRIQKRGTTDRIESEKKSFHKKVAQAFRDLARKDKRFHVYAAEQDRFTLHRQILKDIQNWLRKGKKK